MISLSAAGSIAGLRLAGVSWVRSWWFTNSGSQLAVYGLRFAVHGQAAFRRVPIVLFGRFQ